MNVKELGKDLGYSNDHIDKLRDGEFIEDIHFHKKENCSLIESKLING